MTVTEFRAGGWLVKEWRCCGLIWQVVKGASQGRYFNAEWTCPKCGAKGAA